LNSKDAANLPGPGHFTISDDWSKLKNNAGFGQSNRYNVANSKEGPGPGNYNPTERTLTAAPSYTMSGARPRTAKYELPGPGQYNPRVDYAKENIGGVKIGSSTRGHFASLEVPGPGNYNVSGRLGGPAYGIGSSNRGNMKHDQTPGPG
jgi:hypothetical protein